MNKEQKVFMYELILYIISGILTFVGLAIAVVYGTGDLPGRKSVPIEYFLFLIGLAILSTIGIIIPQEFKRKSKKKLSNKFINISYSMSLIISIVSFIIGLYTMIINFNDLNLMVIGGIATVVGPVVWILLYVSIKLPKNKKK